MTPDLFWLPLLVKIGATVALVVGASVAAERSGPFLGALIATLPVSAGPAYIFLAMAADDAFLAESALNSLAANAAIVLFVLALVFIAPRTGAAASLAGALAVWAIAATVIAAMPWNTLTATCLNLAAFLIAIPATRSVDLHIRPAIAARRWFDLPMRALAVGLLVVGVVTFSHAIGPTLPVWPRSFRSVCRVWPCWCMPGSAVEWLRRPWPAPCEPCRASPWLF
jgi:uncharacterized membrane protein (GlpM family)